MMGWREVVGKWGNYPRLLERRFSFQGCREEAGDSGYTKRQARWENSELAHVRPWVPCPASERKEEREGGRG